MKRSVVVVGAGLGGLSAAIHARLAGHDVLVLEQRDRCGGKAASIEEPGYLLDPGPSIIILPRIYEDVFRRAGREPTDYLKFRRLNPLSRIFFEGQAPLDLPGEKEECLRVLADAVPGDAAAMRKLLHKLAGIMPAIERSVFKQPYERPWQLADLNLIKTALPFDFRRSYKELVDGWFQSGLLRAFFYGFPSYGGQSYHSKSIGALLIPYLMLEEGVWYPEGGVGAIPGAFERLARELGVEVRLGAKVLGLQKRDQSISAVCLADGETVDAEAVICNVDRLTAAAWLGPAPDLEPSYSYFTMHWGARSSMEHVAHHTLLIPKGFEAGFRELYETNAFPVEPIVYLNNTSVTDPAVAPQGCTNLFAVVTSPAKRTGLDWPAALDEYRMRSLRVMSKFEIEPFPVDFERIQTPDTFESRDGSYRGSLYGPAEKHRLWGLFPAGIRDRQYGNLFYCGGSVQPGAGLPMVTLSGQFAAAMIYKL